MTQVTKSSLSKRKSLVRSELNSKGAVVLKFLKNEFDQFFKLIKRELISILKSNL